MENKNDFKPYIPAEKVTPEITVASIVIGILLAVIFGAANAYLGLRVGMTVSASIPAAVIAMGVIRILMRRNSILESNMVQTIGSAGESLAAGAIFTLPALFLWASEGKMSEPSLLEITLIALIGGLLGVFFMVPLRNALIVKEHGVLPYPEGTACAEVLLAGEKGGANASTVFAGMGFAALFKFIIDGLKVVSGEISAHVKGYAGEIGTQIYPAVMSVGYICGARISSYMFAGGVLSWLVIIPLIVLFGENIVLYPGNVAIGELYASGGAGAIWSTYIRYIGAGALAAGGIISLIKSLPLIIKTFGGAVKGFSATGDS
ncbi:MAG: oligopeptide transporter, OPT family, partial [Clostridia bacterium]|nr:oligopeptide transporter, OPT family [Clostridia bacterium]